MIALPAGVGLIRPASSSGAYLNGLATTPIAAYGLEKLISTAINAIRVRRSSDNAEQNIGFSGDALDTSALASFVGSSSAYITTFYDQTGNGYNMVQATASKQPRIVNAGTYDGIAIFDAVDDAMSISSLALSQAQLGLYTKGRYVATGTTDIFMESSPNWNSNTFCFIFYTISSGYEAGMNSSVAVTQRANRFTGMAVGTEKVVSLLYDRSLTGTGEIKAWTNGTSHAVTSPFANEMSGSFAANNIYIGGRGGTSLYSTMRLFSLAFYNADTAGIRSNIESILA